MIRQNVGRDQAERWTGSQQSLTHYQKDQDVRPNINLCQQSLTKSSQVLIATALVH